MTEFNQKVKLIAGDLLDAILIAVSYIFVIVVFLLKLAVSVAGIWVISAVLYSKVFGGNIEALFTPAGTICTSFLTAAYWAVDYMVASEI